MRYLLLALTLTGCAVAGSGETPYRSGPQSYDGTGRYYMGREISQVMGHQGAAWLERPERALEERPDEVVRRLELAPNAVVADIGAGTGYFSLRLARAVPEGRVLAVDIQPEMLEMLTERAQWAGFGNIEPILGAVDDPKLPEGEVDLVLMVDVYHELYWPEEMLAAIVTALAEGGRVVLVEYRGEDPNVPIKPRHKMTEKQVRLELEAAGLTWKRTYGFLPSQHVIVFAKESS